MASSYIPVNYPERNCSVCGELKPQSEFYKDRSTVHGFSYKCKACELAKHRKYVAENPERIRFHGRKAYLPVDHPERECPVCGKRFKPKRAGERGSVCCSSGCRAKAINLIHTKEKACLQCGAVFTPVKADKRIKYCSEPCRRKAQPIPKRQKKSRVCAFCKAEFYPLKGGSKRSTHEHCSIKCRYDRVRESNLIKNASCDIAWSHCRVCSMVLTANPNTPRIVCKDCLELHSHAAYSASPEHLAARLQGKPCRVCGKDFAPYQNASDVCSIECRRQTEEHKASRRIHKAKRRAMERTNGPYEDIDPITIFERDGWCCWLCGISTPKELRGTYHNRAPELDHKIPLTRGGYHVSDNVACSCRDCNQLKSDKLIYKTDDDVYVIDSRHDKHKRLVSLYA